MQKMYNIETGNVSKTRGSKSLTLNMSLSEVQAMPGMIGMVSMPMAFDSPTDDEKAAIQDLDNYQVQAVFTFVKIAPAASATSTDSGTTASPTTTTAK